MSSIEWETPKDFFDALDEEFHFDIDLCATRHNAKCSPWFTPKDDALNQRWVGVCWMNPPYNKNIGLWLSKAWEEAQHGSLIVALIPGRSSDTKWWHDYIMKASEIRYIKDRLHFGLGGKFTRSNNSNIIVIFGPHCQGPPQLSSIDIHGNKLLPQDSPNES